MNIGYRLFLLAFLLTLLAPAAQGQRVLLIEKSGSAKTQKIFEGQYIEYRLRDDEDWYPGDIREFRIDQNLIELDDRYIKLDEIDAFRYSRGWSQALGYSLVTFGVSWSGFALIGNWTDGDPETKYGSGDAIVTGTSIGLGVLMSQLFKHKVVRFGGRKRLRMVDISFK